MQAKCYICDQDSLLTAKDSDEHIIPQSLGSPLSSFGILCEKHNNDLGGEVDQELFAQIGNFADMLGVNRHTTRKIIVGFDSDQRRYATSSGLKGIFEVRLVIDRPNKGPFTIYAQGFSEGDARKKARRIIIQQCKKKHDAVKYLQILDNSRFIDDRPKDNLIWIENKTTTKPRAHRLHFNPKMVKALIKIAVNYYLLNKGDENQIKDLIDIMKRPADETIILSPQIVRMVGPKSVGRTPQTDEISHVLGVKGSSADGYLWVYIELFCYLRVIVFMNLTYNGPDISAQYGYNLLAKSTFKPVIDFSKSKQDMLNMQFNDDNYDFLSDNLERLIQTFNSFRLSKK